MTWLPIVGAIIAYAILLLCAFLWDAGGRDADGKPPRRFSRRWWVRRAPLGVLLLAAALAVLWLALVLIVGVAVGASVALRELVKHFYPTLGVLCAVWAASRLWPRAWLRVVAAACVPWIIGMGSLVVLVQGTRLFLPAADWQMLIRIQTLAGSAQDFLKAVTPGGWITQLSLTVVALALGLAAPSLAVWAPRVRKALSWAGKVAAVLAVFTTYSFYGASYGTSGIVAFTKEEGRRRVQPDARALAEQQIAERIRRDPAADARALNQYLAAVAEGVRLQKQAEALQAERLPGSRPVPPQPLTPDDGTRLLDRAAELAKAVARSRVSQAAGAHVTGAIEGLMGRPLTLQERAQAHDAFKRGLSIVLGQAAAMAAGPLIEGLQGKDGSELGKKIAEDLYEQQVERATDPISSEMADAWFHAGGPQAAGVALAIPPEVLAPAFQAESIPLAVLHPDLQTLRRQVADKSQRQGGQKIKELIEREIAKIKGEEAR
jgi:hypothetical protein